MPYQKAAEAFARMKPTAVILSGGPASVLDKDAPLAPQGIVRRRRAGPRHLLRRAGDGAPARRQGRGRTPSRVRPRRGAGHRGHAAVRGRVEEGRALSGLDEPRRPRHRAAQGLPRGRHLGECADRHDRRREAQVLRHAIPSRGDAHAAGRGAAAQLRAQDRAVPRRLDDARLQGRGDRAHPQAGRPGPGDLRLVRRRRQRGRGGADPRGDRRPAHLRVRRSRPAAPERRQDRGRSVPRPLQHSAGARRCFGAVPRRARPA